MPPILRFRKLCFSDIPKALSGTRIPLSRKPNSHPPLPRNQNGVVLGDGAASTRVSGLLGIYVRLGGSSSSSTTLFRSRKCFRLSPGTRLSREGLKAHHPMVLVPGIVTGGLELWEGRPCAEGLFRKRLWGGSFTEILRRCPCGGSIKHDVSPSPKFKHDFDTQPGSMYFTCTKFKDDGLHFRQPWVFGVEQDIEKLVMKVEEQSKTIEEM
ncbi:unnamed protein product [Thlaspi arvense]|uniref:Uncharacterized protein n=1 Tax=Thlaspi arvense TaxID=13288 RepID=A0AAU9SG08_THLAR|nr:unnamed protein product [Thlaspi arvense]